MGVPHAEQEMPTLPKHLILAHKGSCCPVICVSLFHVIVLSFGFLILIVPFIGLRGISVDFT